MRKFLTLLAMLVRAGRRRGNRRVSLDVSVRISRRARLEQATRFEVPAGSSVRAVTNQLGKQARLRMLLR